MWPSETRLTTVRSESEQDLENGAPFSCRPTPEAPLGVQMTVVFLGPHGVVCILISSKDTSHAELGPTHVASFSPNSIFKGPISRYTF